MAEALDLESQLNVESRSRVVVYIPRDRESWRHSESRSRVAAAFRV